MRLVFMGSPEFAVPCLRALVEGRVGDGPPGTRHEVALVVSQPDKPAGRGGQLAAPAVKTAALELGLEVFQPRSARTGELRDRLKASGAELAVVVAYGKILPKDVLEALPRGCINVHASILPAYRGAAPVQWAVIHNQPETGVAIMQLDEGMDTGPVLLERRTAIDPDETSGELLARLSPIGAAALLEALDQITAGTATPIAQDHAAATHAPMLAKSDGAIDFSQPAALVAARIRGVDPWPGAQALLRGQIVKLFRARPDPAPATPLHAELGTPVFGTVLAVDARGMHVMCGDGAIAIRDIQAPGRKRLTAQQFAAGRGVAPGDVLAKPVIE
jgi:methionyl-tRNA formyltransferase